MTTNVWNKLYHRNLLSNLPDSLNAEKIFWGDDQVLNLYLLENCDNALFIPDVLYAYRQFSGATNKFSLHTMHDLDSIKRYQQIFLNRYQGTDKDKMQNILYSEVAGWFYAYVQQGLAYLNEDKLKELITDTLRLPNFQLARKYYLNKPSESWPAVNLLRQADPDEYIKTAKESIQSSQSLRKRLHTILKHIYTHL